ncbi:hypothetical protein AJ80_09171 [Polytolypa hystricis UAMH7299]|uniref:Uncharacterized protein n=1 Tax=Polytolypa hystricis (strain UAMH7299) TaxID=1447883 RepID=A0A2B7WV71_POLH7|nr:hypothetical protein AJ80_09171 [Polytolypa hystricis UAMH7299]
MAEYWKSTPKYWCQHCKVYVRDTPLEKSNHEATGRHQGGLKRFIRDIHRDNERSQRENQKAKSEVERLKGLVSGSPVDNASSVKQKPAAPTEAPPRSVVAEERKKQMTQLVGMGVAIPEEFRPDMALAGEWQTVETPSTSQEDIARLNIGVRKRKFEGQEEEEAAGEIVARKGWGSTTRTYPGEDDADLEALLGMTKEIKGKKAKQELDMKQEIKLEADEGSVKREEDDGASATKKEESTDATLDSIPDKHVGSIKKEDESLPEVKTEESQNGIPDSVPVASSEGSEEVEPAVVFKKRKPKHSKR